MSCRPCRKALPNDRPIFDRAKKAGMPMIGRLGGVPARTKSGPITCVAAALPRMLMKSRRLMLSLKEACRVQYSKPSTLRLASEEQWHDTRSQLGHKRKYSHRADVVALPLEADIRFAHL